MIEATTKDAAVARDELKLLLVRSSVLLGGLEDPFAANFEMHRWLSGAREEVYSDWLDWILQRNRQSINVLRLFGLQAPSFLETKCEVVREHCISGGRLDLVIRCGLSLTSVVEIKTTAEVAEHQWTTYLAWLRKQPCSHGPVLLAIDKPEDFPEQHWIFRSWENVAMALRNWASIWWIERRQIDAVMTLSFCSAVEQNLLGLRTKGLNAIRTARYLERWLEDNEDGKKHL
jgi:hypothetical protein